MLLIHPPSVALYTELDARNAIPPARFEVTAPEDAPNILLILIDDMGFGVPSTFGGPAHMPTLDTLASSGVRYNMLSEKIAGIVKLACAFKLTIGLKESRLIYQVFINQSLAVFVICPCESQCRTFNTSCFQS